MNASTSFVDNTKNYPCCGTVLLPVSPAAQYSKARRCGLDVLGPSTGPAATVATARRAGPLAGSRAKSALRIESCAWTLAAGNLQRSLAQVAHTCGFAVRTRRHDFSFSRCRSCASVEQDSITVVGFLATTFTQSGRGSGGLPERTIPGDRLGSLQRQTSVLTPYACCKRT